MLKRLRMWWENKKYEWAKSIIKPHGFSIVRIVNRAGTDYLVANDGRMFRIGREKK